MTSYAFLKTSWDGSSKELKAAVRSKLVDLFGPFKMSLHLETVPLVVILHTEREITEEERAQAAAAIENL